MKLEGKKALVFGTGMSGIGAAKLLQKEGASVILYDGNASLMECDIRKRLGDQNDVDIILGELSDEIIASLDFMVISPGVPTDLPIVNRIRDEHIPIWSEIELAYVVGQGTILAITGTNGKTTTTSLLGEIMKAWKENVYVVGNIGIPYTSIARQTDDESIVVAEISSFQLETIDTFHPNVSAILNITPDHLDRHHTMEAYISAKEAIARNQTKDDTCVLNYEDEETRRFGETLSANVLYFSSERVLPKGVYLEENTIVYCNGKEKTMLCHVDELQILGKHNYENAMAAAAMAIAAGTPMDIISKVLRSFTGVEHRMEYVCEKNGVIYYNDSKGTNPDAAIKAIGAMTRPTYLIGGGYDKHASYEEWIESFQGKVRKLILIGETKEQIAADAKKCGFYDILYADTLEEAVKTCASMAKEGEAVLLSPACASWGMFRNYEERGNQFKEYVNAL